MCLCSVLTYLSHPLHRVLSSPHLLLGLMLLMLHVKQLLLELGAKYAEHPPCGGQLHLQEVRTNVCLDRWSTHCGANMLWCFVWCSVTTVL